MTEAPKPGAIDFDSEMHCGLNEPEQAAYDAAVEKGVLGVDRSLERMEALLPIVEAN